MYALVRVVYPEGRMEELPSEREFLRLFGPGLELVRTERGSRRSLGRRCIGQDAGGGSRLFDDGR